MYAPDQTPQYGLAEFKVRIQLVVSLLHLDVLTILGTEKYREKREARSCSVVGRSTATELVQGSPADDNINSAVVSCLASLRETNKCLRRSRCDHNEM